MENKKTLRIIVPIIMITVVIGIWFSQNQGEEVVEYSEFPLNVEAVDLAELSLNNLPIIVDFGADECVPCKEMAPVLVALNAQMQGKAIVQFVDVWKNPEGASGFPVQVIPTQILVNADGTPYMPSDEVTGNIEFILYSDRDTEEHLFTAHQGGLTEEQLLMILHDMGVET